MNCDRCGKPSVYHSTLIVNGVSQTTNLCRDCAIKEGVFNESPTGLFDDFFSVFNEFLPFEKVKDVSCPVCKTRLIDFKNTQRLGCSNCYNVFKAEIDSLLKKIAPFDRHKQEISSSVKPKKTKETKSDKIEKLRQDMTLAVKEERYEDAAKIKKQIQKLEAENE